MRKYLCATLLVLCATLILCATATRAHDVYMGWKQPGNGAPCCNEKKTVDGYTTGDCYPTEARLAPTGGGSGAEVAWFALKDTGEWVQIPDSKIIRQINPDETGTRAHLCESYGQILCFVPPFGGG